MNYQILPNIIALVLSLIASIYLIKLALKMKGGELAKVINLIVAGILCAVTLHAGVEMAEVYNLLPEGVVFAVMGALLSVGSLLFIAAGLKAKSIFS